MATETLRAPQIQPRPEFAGILREQQNFGTGAGEKVGDQINDTFDKMMLQSGLEVSPPMILLLSMCSAITLGGVLFVVQENFLTAAMGFAFGMVLPYAWVVISRSRRQTKMMNQLPEMVDELARAGRTGRSIEQCFSMVADDTVSPLGDELRLCAKKLDMGVGLRAALDELPTRTGLVSLNILVMALSVHQVGGGDLVGVLERLSHTIRERIQYLGRLRAATAASRATAVLMIALPPAILGFFMLRDPEYLSKLMSATWGRNLTIIAVVLDIIGIVWVLRIMKSSQRT